MPAVKAADPRAIFTREEWAHLSAVSRWRGPWLVLHCWAVIALVIATATWIAHPAAWIAAVIIVGGRQLGLAILMHDAAHGLLHPKRAINNFLGQWLTGAPTGTDLKAYRAYHLKHHRYTQQEEDPDLVLSRPFPTTRASMARKIARDLSGLTFLKQRGAQMRGGLAGAAAMARGRADEIARIKARSLGRFLLANALLLALSLALYGWTPFLIWLAALATVFQLVLRVRNIAEHACAPVGSEDPFTHARTTLAGPIARALLAPYWVNYHAEHHLFMGLPCYRLGEAHRMLKARGHAAGMTIARDYLSVMREVTARPQKAAA